MAGKPGVVQLTILRTAAEPIIDTLIRLDVSQQLINRFTEILEHTQGGDLLKNAIHEWVNNLPAHARTLVEPLTRRILYGPQAGDIDMAYNKKGGQQKGPAMVNLQEKGRNNVADLSADKKKVLLKHFGKTQPRGKQDLAYANISGLNKNALIDFADELLKLKDKEADEHFAYFLRLDTFVEMGRSMMASLEETNLCREVLDWALGLDKKKKKPVYHKLTWPMTSEDNDSDKDRPNWTRWLASFHSLGKEKAFEQLKLICDNNTKEQIARMAGVRPNYLTKGVKLLKSGIEVISGIRKTDIDQASIAKLDDEFAGYRQLFGLKPAATGTTTTPAATSDRSK